jgi:hypothetical protein
VKDRDPIRDPGRDTLTSLAFENDDHGRGDLPGGNRSPHLLDEEPGCPSSVPPPASRTRPNHVRGVDQKHFGSLAASAAVSLLRAPTFGPRAEDARWPLNPDHETLLGGAHDPGGVVDVSPIGWSIGTGRT